MPHADAALVPSNVTNKAQFWEHVYGLLEGLLEAQKNWVSNCANASSLIYNSLLAFPSHFGPGERAVNWCGFYIDSSLFPRPSLSSRKTEGLTPKENRLLLGPFCGKPACQFINTIPGKSRGVCADAYIQRKTLVVPDVDAYPGHIACDGETKSEIVCPLLLLDGRCIGVFDLDCLALNGFDENDKVGLERITKLVVDSCEW
ncbi:GAF domain-like protein [Fomitiporia mediterranea MF3/22]|uniref:GAF domain-like protein n=1 Tax=Fomitiporia mediterranea (strain MF3/22) TaxID=694068 RepID=UPI000440870D|nr:GAF domain-like protein [Fomitiporia mediterranea MF3/22]EJD02643.1 GAF domain-like protein [Fomitiporia mediterranea MF3/22]